MGLHLFKQRGSDTGSRSRAVVAGYGTDGQPIVEKAARAGRCAKLWKLRLATQPSPCWSRRRMNSHVSCSDGCR